jgi:polyferredoxin
MLAGWLAIRKRSRTGLLILGVFSLFYFGFWRRGCVCPVGSLQNIVLALSFADYSPGWLVSAFFVLPLLTALIVGRVFCAGVCPLGAIQDIVILRPVKIPDWLDSTLRVIPFVYLGLAVLFTVMEMGFIVCRFDPFVTIFRLSGTQQAWILAGAFLLAGAFIARPYCRYFCPYGVLLGWMSRLSWRHLTITPTECIQCRLCENACPFNAIVRPGDSSAMEGKQRRARRLVGIISLLPFLLGAWLLLGWYFGGALAKFHPVVKLAERVKVEETHAFQNKSLETEAFRASNVPVNELYKDAMKISRRCRIGGLIFGIFVAVVIFAKLVAWAVPYWPDRYMPNSGNCFSCGRCFEYCPVGKSPEIAERIKNRSKK